jgi:S-adenosyl-L-methionine hydrolase (adenosine-forming)
VVITFLTDFGLEDDFVGACHGVIRRIAPDAQIIDVTHGIPPQQVLQGALVLANTLPYMPVGVHLAVVDPGVGTARRALVLRGGDGRLYVGPDNGLLSLSADRLGGVVEAWNLVNPAYRLEPVSHTFHGRDVFAPAAAHLVQGVEPASLGPPIDPDSLVRLDLPEATVRDGEIRAHVLIVDRFGNVQLNVTAEDLRGAGIEPGTQIELEIAHERYFASAARTFADVRLGDLVLYEDSYWNVAVAINAGNAADMLAARPGDKIGIRTRG